MFDEIKNMVWSYSRISAFAQCKYSFYLKYIIGDDELYLAEGNYYAELGSFMHAILEKIFKNELQLESAVDYFAEHYDENVLYTASESTMTKSYEACIYFLENLDLSELDKYEILGVEKEFTITSRGHNFKGFIDLLLRNKETGEIVLVDHKSAKYPLSKKTGKVLKSSEEVFESYKHQMYLYSNAIKQEYGAFPSYIAWNHFKENEVSVIHFDQKEYKKAMTWFFRMINSIEKEQDFTENVDWFYCSNLCDFRASCEYIADNKAKANE